MKLIVAVLAVLLGGWLLVDGVKALTQGDYTTAKSGPYAGQLGPWSKIVTAMGIDPRGTPMKIAHVILGALWLLGCAALFMQVPMGRFILIGAAIGSLWYVPFGTVIGLAEICLLFSPALLKKF